MQGRKQFGQLRNTGHPIVKVLQIMRRKDGIASVIKLVFTVIETQSELVCAEFPYVLIGVLGAFQFQNLRFDADTVKETDRLSAAVLPASSISYAITTSFV